MCEMRFKERYHKKISLVNHNHYEGDFVITTAKMGNAKTEINRRLGICLFKLNYFLIAFLAS